MTYHCGLRKENCRTSKRGTAVLNLILGLAFIIMLAIFLVQSSLLISKSYQVQNYQQRLSEGQAKTDKLEIQQTESKSFMNLQQVAESLNLVAAENIKYLEVPQSSVALTKTLTP